MAKALGNPHLQNQPLVDVAASSRMKVLEEVRGHACMISEYLEVCCMRATRCHYAASIFLDRRIGSATRSVEATMISNAKTDLLCLPMPSLQRMQRAFQTSKITKHGKNGPIREARHTLHVSWKVGEQSVCYKESMVPLDSVRDAMDVLSPLRLDRKT